ncbi:hypothetical protein I5G61_gp13 [Mycobacterium phage Quesadilla]|uniref:DUF7196 domain-containing protein n=1 Tax=Mycobacterium phage Quesadilla TaxID=2664226 RepID=A0A5Q2W9Q9_9CAUD|nr:hypothetical protein I5G61_gp13 [Mycobacterium phage Quesadilla]QGH75261.1 hypothetical protein SEA_QUESADILLA_13 [Mycobacterium phage Quesadilla]
MGCNCGGRTAANSSDTLGYYVTLPDGTVLPSGFDPADPEGAVPPYFGYYEARNQIVLNGGGTVRRAKRQPAEVAPA